MNKKTFIHRLRTVMREINCMSDTTFNERFHDGTIKFCRYRYGELAKDLIEIKIKLHMIDSIRTDTINK